MSQLQFDWKTCGTSIKTYMDNTFRLSFICNLNVFTRLLQMLISSVLEWSRSPAIIHWSLTESSATTILLYVRLQVVAGGGWYLVLVSIQEWWLGELHACKSLKNCQNTGVKPKSEMKQKSTNFWGVLGSRIVRNIKEQTLTPTASLYMAHVGSKTWWSRSI